jgi:hypothetical protein
MHEYTCTFEEVKSWTIPQLLFFVDKIMDRQERELKKEAKLHGADYKTQGLDTDGAVPIEYVMDGNTKL